jgi:hypothetical protein
VAKSCLKWGLKKEKSGVRPLILAKQRAFFTKNFEKLRNIKVHIFWEGHKILQNLHLTFLSYVVPVNSTLNCKKFTKFFPGEFFFTNFCGLLGISQLKITANSTIFPREFFFTNFGGLL